MIPWVLNFLAEESLLVSDPFLELAKIAWKVSSPHNHQRGIASGHIIPELDSAFSNPNRPKLKKQPGSSNVRGIQFWPGISAGIISRLDHLVDLGVGAVWLSPVYKSPMADFGYDISDFTDIDPIFGNLEDFDQLLREAHKKGKKAWGELCCISCS